MQLFQNYLSYMYINDTSFEELQLKHDKTDWSDWTHNTLGH